MQDELQSLTNKELRERAVAAGISAQKIEAARDEEEPKPALIALIVEDAASKAKVQHDKLQALNVKALRERAAAAGISAQKIEAARDAEEPKPALIKLLLGLQDSGSGDDTEGPAVTSRAVPTQGESSDLGQDTIEVEPAGSGPPTAQQQESLAEENAHGNVPMSRRKARLLRTIVGVLATAGLVLLGVGIAQIVEESDYVYPGKRQAEFLSRVMITIGAILIPISCAIWGCCLRGKTMRKRTQIVPVDELDVARTLIVQQAPAQEIDRGGAHVTSSALQQVPALAPTSAHEIVRNLEEQQQDAPAQAQPGTHSSHVVIPAGCTPGTQFPMQAPNGAQHMITVPAGTMPGQTICVHVPALVEDDQGGQLALVEEEKYCGPKSVCCQLLMCYFTCGLGNFFHCLSDKSVKLDTRKVKQLKPGSVYLCAEKSGPSCTSAENPRVQKSWNADTRSWDQKDLPYFYPPRAPDECFSLAALPRCLLYTPFCFTALVAFSCMICHDADEAYHPTDEKLRDYSIRRGLNWAGNDTSREAILQSYRQELAERRAERRRQYGEQMRLQREQEQREQEQRAEQMRLQREQEQRAKEQRAEQMRLQREQEQRAKEQRAKEQAQFLQEMMPSLANAAVVTAKVAVRAGAAVATGGQSEMAYAGVKAAQGAVNVYNGGDVATESLKIVGSLATEGVLDDALDTGDTIEEGAVATNLAAAAARKPSKAAGMAVEMGVAEMMAEP